MKTFSSTVRTSDNNLNGNKFKLSKILQPTVYNTLNIVGEIKNIEDFLKINPPAKPSDNLINAIKKAFDSNSSVTFNSGKGNQTFYFFSTINQ